jgi:hypothetical protein
MGGVEAVSIAEFHHVMPHALAAWDSSVGLDAVLLMILAAVPAPLEV